MAGLHDMSWPERVGTLFASLPETPEVQAFPGAYWDAPRSSPDSGYSKLCVVMALYPRGPEIVRALDKAAWLYRKKRRVRSQDLLKLALGAGTFSMALLAAQGLFRLSG